jgi:uncharacterized membrane protein YqjE
MSKNKPAKKKVVISTKSSKNKVTATTATRLKTTTATAKHSVELVFGKQQYTLMLIGLGLIFVGLACMTGGAMPSPDIWDENIIYNKRITVVAPILILAGLTLEIYAIFKR